MTDLLLDAIATGWPIALTCASVVAVERGVALRRRTRLNGALHELRRPLQALALGAARQAHLERAIAALGDLDREINGGAPAPRVPVAARRLAEEAIERWRPVVARRGRRLELRWKANGTRLFCRPGAIAAALDNLIVNALEHGEGTIHLEAGVAAGHLRLRVSNGRGDPSPDSGAPQTGGRGAGRRDPRRGHGLRLVAAVAADHGGRFVACRDDDGATAVIELPLAGHPPPAA
jgi:signal transduction histidine kinase